MPADRTPAEKIFDKYEMNSHYGGAHRDELLEDLKVLAGEVSPTPGETPSAPPVPSGGDSEPEANGGTWGNRNA